MTAKILFLAGLILSGSSLVSPPVSLALGLTIGLIFATSLPLNTKAGSKLLLQVSVVGLGFGIKLHQLIQIGRTGFIYTAVSIILTITLGWYLGKWMGVNQRSAYLISVGTAICGGSAIAAVAPVIEAKDEELMASLSTIFILNSVALIMFPFIGTWLALTQEQFGLWAALAIHDTSSLVGASAKYGDVALTVGTTIKLGRALWIVPIVMITALSIRPKANQEADSLATGARQSNRKRNRMGRLPWFVLFFVCASAIATFIRGGDAVYAWLTVLARAGLTVTLYLIGTSISRNTLKAVGVRSLLLGVSLWMIITTAMLGLVYIGIITL